MQHVINIKQFSAFDHKHNKYGFNRAFPIVNNFIYSCILETCIIFKLVYKLIEKI